MKKKICAFLAFLLPLGVQAKCKGCNQPYKAMRNFEMKVIAPLRETLKIKKNDHLTECYAMHWKKEIGFRFGMKEIYTATWGEFQSHLDNGDITRTGP